jgi:hypothetical protein
LATKGHIRQRIAELPAQTAAEAGIRATLLADAARLHQLALEAGNLGVAAQAIKLKAVLAGEWVEKSDVTRRSADLDTLSDAELLVIARGADATSTH